MSFSSSVTLKQYAGALVSFEATRSLIAFTIDGKDKPNCQVKSISSTSD